MTAMKRLILAVCAILLPSAALAQGPARVEPLPDQYTMSCAPGQTLIESGFAVGDCKTITETNSHTSQNVLFRFGSQWKLSNVGSTAPILFCLHYSQTTTITYANGIQMTAGAPISDTDEANCVPVDSAQADYTKISPLKWTSGYGRCTTVAEKGRIGAACTANSNCGTTGVCTQTLQPQGVYASLCNVGTAGQTVFVSGCDQ